jgi:hypothetical protein
MLENLLLKGFLVELLGENSEGLSPGLAGVIGFDAFVNDGASSQGHALSSGSQLHHVFVVEGPVALPPGIYFGIGNLENFITHSIHLLSMNILYHKEDLL